MNTEPLVTTPESASAMFDHGQCVLVDVRTPVEFASTHVPGSLNIPLDRLSKEFVETHPAVWREFQEKVVFGTPAEARYCHPHPREFHSDPDG